MDKMYRRFYDVDDKEVWASYDGKNIEVLLQHTVDGFDVPTYRLETRLMLDTLLNEVCGIVVSYQNWRFPIYNYDTPEEFTFSDEDVVSSDGSQYKFFIDRGGNWLEFVVSDADGEEETLSSGHLDQINMLLEGLLVSKGVDLKAFARYSEDSNNTEYHVPIEKDFLEDFDITR